MKNILLFTLLLSVFFCQAQYKLYNEKEIDIKAVFPGGFNEWIKFVKKNFKWSSEKNSQIVRVEFIVQSDGSVFSPIIMMPVGNPNENEALRVMALSPKWTPAILKENPVSCRLTTAMFNTIFECENFGILGTSNVNTPIVIENKSINNLNDSIFNSSAIEVKPEFPGGIEKFYYFFNNKFKVSTKEALKGKIYMSFVVEKDGTLTDIKVLRDIGFDSGKDALRVLMMSPKWNPGLQNGKNIRVNYVLPIPVDLNNGSLFEKK